MAPAAEKRDPSIIHVPVEKSMDLEDIDEGGDGGGALASSYGGIGQDTLEEIEDKARFYQDLERKGHLDYGHLNKQLQDQETMKSLLLDEQQSATNSSYSPSKNRNNERTPQRDVKVSISGRKNAGKEIDVTNLLGNGKWFSPYSHERCIN